MDKAINTVEDIDCSSETGQLLMASLAVITTECRPKSQPDDVINELHMLAGKMEMQKIQTRTCGNCKEWKMINPLQGKCSASASQNKMMNTGCGLNTHKDFGCILFEKK